MSEIRPRPGTVALVLEQQQMRGGLVAPTGAKLPTRWVVLASGDAGFEPGDQVVPNTPKGGKIDHGGKEVYFFKVEDIFAHVGAARQPDLPLPG